MKTFAPWLLAAFLLFAWPIPSFAAHAAAAKPSARVTTIHIVLPPDASTPPIRLKPGIYASAGEGALAGGEDLRGFKLTIDHVTGRNFRGELAAMHVDPDGKLVRAESRFTGSIVQPGTHAEALRDQVAAPPPYAYTVITFASPVPRDILLHLQDEPLKHVLGHVTGLLLTAGFNLSWKTKQRDQIGEGAYFVPASAAEYQKTLGLYTQLAGYQARVAELQDDAVRFAEARFKAYMQASAKFLESPPERDMQKTVAKLIRLYKEEKKLTGNGELPKRDPPYRKVRLLVMQMAVLREQALEVFTRRRNARAFWASRGEAVANLVAGSKCLRGTPDQDADELAAHVASACSRLLDASKRLQQREAKVNAVLKISDHYPDLRTCVFQSAKWLAGISSGRAPSACRQRLAKL